MIKTCFKSIISSICLLSIHAAYAAPLATTSLIHYNPASIGLPSDITVCWENDHRGVTIACHSYEKCCQKFTNKNAYYCCPNNLTCNAINTAPGCY